MSNEAEIQGEPHPGAGGAEEERRQQETAAIEALQPKPAEPAAREQGGQAAPPAPPTTPHTRPRRVGWSPAPRWTNFLIMLATIANVGVAFYQWSALGDANAEAKRTADAAADAVTETRRSNDLARDNARLDQRAWVGPQGASSRLTVTIGQKVAAAIAIGNSGRTPALNVRLQSGMKVVAANDTLLFTYPAPSLDRGVFVIHPGGTTTINLASDNVLSPSAVKEIQGELVRVVFYGYVLYDDIFRSHTRVTSFCFVIRPTLVLGHCSTYNYAD